MLAIVSSTTGCGLLSMVAHAEADYQCERSARTFDDVEACKAKRKRLNEYDKSRQAQDRNIHLGPKTKS
jgi:hypothetical protein